MALVAAIVCTAVACTTLDSYPVEGTLAAQPFELRVDSEVAAYYARQYLAGRRTDPDLDPRIDALYDPVTKPLPDRDELKRLADAFSVDFAAIHFADRIARQPDSRRFREAFRREHARVQRALGEVSPHALPAEASGYQVLFVPGFLYRMHPGTGADFASPRNALTRVGLSHQLIETDEDAAVEVNAKRVLSGIEAASHSGRKLIVVSASKSGAEVGLALSELRGAQAEDVKAWINIVGTLQGSPLADNALQRGDWALGMAGVDRAGIESLGTARSRARFLDLRLPAGLLVVNYIGIPVLGSVSSRGRDGYLDLREHGPNDGLSLLGDLIAPASLTVAELGRDHFLLDDELDGKTIALASTVIVWLERCAYPGKRASGTPRTSRPVTAKSPPACG